MLWKSSAVASQDLEQRKQKANLLFAAMAQLGVDALTVGEGDLAFGVDFVTEGAKKHALPYVSANLKTAAGVPLFPDALIVEKGGLKIGITGATSSRYAGLGVQALPVADSVRSVVERLRTEDKVDLVVLLSHQGLEEDRKLAEAVPGIDVIFSAHDRRMQFDPLVVGDTAIFEAGSRGKHLGQVQLRLQPGRKGWADEAGRKKAQARKVDLEGRLARYKEQESAGDDERSHRRAKAAVQRIERQLETLVIPPGDDGTRNEASGKQVPMGRDIADEPKMAALVLATLDELGETVGTGGGHDGHDHSGHDHSGHDHSGHDHAAHSPKKPAGPYVGVAVCMACHAAEYADWSATSHAHAWKTLVGERRHFDQDCWSCHVTAAEKPGGPQHPKEVGSLGNVQCEACHGPGQKHVSNPKAVDMVKSPGEALCLTCHTEEMTEGRFVYKDYLPKVDHKP